MAKSPPPREVEQLAQQSLRQASLARPSLQFRHRCWLAFERALDPHRETDRVKLSVRDLSTGASFHLEIAPAKAIDAFYHPYAYPARLENSHRVVRAETTIVDG